MIWHAAIPDPRIVHIRKRFLTADFSERVFARIIEDLPSHRPFKDSGRINSCRGWRSHTSPPNLLLVCHESFKVASAYYTKAFGGSYNFPETGVDFKRDTLYLDLVDLHELAIYLVDISPSDAAMIRNLAVYEHFPSQWDEVGYEDWLCNLLMLFNGLEKLIIVVAQMHKAEDGDGLVFKSLDDLPPDNIKIELPFASDYGKMFNKALHRMRHILKSRRQMVDLHYLHRCKRQYGKKAGKTWGQDPEIGHQIIAAREARIQLESDDKARVCIEHA